MFGTRHENRGITVAARYEAAEATRLLQMREMKCLHVHHYIQQ
jgi:hypothetical protein